MAAILSQPKCVKMSFEGQSYIATTPTNDISIEFEIRPKFAMLLFKMYSTDHKEKLQMSRHLHCRDTCKIPLCSVEHISN